MNLWIIATIITALLIVGAIGVTGIVKAQQQNASKISCSTCKNQCTAENNCGSATCGAVTGGKCTCKG